MAYRFRNWHEDHMTELVNNLVAGFNGMTDNTDVQGTNADEMTKILSWALASCHRLNPLAILDDDGNPYEDQAAFDADIETVYQFEEIFRHNLIGLVNSWRQAQTFMNNDNGKNISETKFNPIDNQLQTVTNPTNAARVDYNNFSSASVSDQGLVQVSKILVDIYAEFTQYLDTFDK